MYQDFFQLAERPFKSNPCAHDYFPSQDGEQALQLCRLAIEEASGPAVVIGGTGTGKSMVLSVIADQYRDRFALVRLTTNSLRSPADLLQNILFELNCPYRGMLEGEMRLALMEYLNRESTRPEGILILCDEADTLNEEILNEFKSILNYVCEGQPRVRLILAGGPRLEETLTLPALDSFNQRIAARCFLRSMGKAETTDYIDRHLNRCGRPAEEIFERDALSAIHEITQGVPRLINQLCCHSMIVCASYGQKRVGRNHVAQAWTDIQQLPVPWETGNAKEHQSMDDWAIVEFGQLDEGTTESENLSFQPEPMFSDSLPSSLDPNADSSELHLAPEETVYSTDPIAEEYSIDSLADEPQLNQSQPTDSHGPSSGSSAEELFGTGFDEEEVVVDEFTRWSAEQNRTSLEVTEQELEQLISQADNIQSEVSTVLDSENVGPEVVFASTEPEAPVNENSEIRQLYEIYDNQQQLADQIAIAAQPQDARDEPVAMDYPITEHAGFRSGSQTEPEVVADDRDMLMVSHGNLHQTKQEVAPEPEPTSGPSSTGQAFRMNYQTLFQQLRGDATNASPRP